MPVNECDARIECCGVRGRGSQGGFEGTEGDECVGARDTVEVLRFCLASR